MSDSADSRGWRSRWPLVIGFACLLLLLVALVLRRGSNEAKSRTVDSTKEATPAANVAGGPDKSWRPGARAGRGRSAEEIVSAKVVQFARSRREFVYAIGRRAKKEVPKEVEEFFDALERGNWGEIEALFKGFAKRSGQYEGSTHSPELDEFWPAMLDAYGAAEQAHDWPAQKLLDYGNAVLDSLRPGMVYMGGTDPGRWIPSLMNDTSDGERHIVVTQNALADKRYLDYLEFQYGDRFATLTPSDSDRAFADYIADARKRFEHDQEFPNEPKQVRPGENVGMVDGKFQVSGQVSVMDINERLFRMLMEKNPGLPFAMEESFPFKSVLADATPLGPIMEVKTGNTQTTLTPERAAETVDYWRNTTGQLLNDPDAQSSAEVRKTYSKLLSSQAGMFLEQQHPGEAETLFRMAYEVCPYSPEAVYRYCNLLIAQNRVNETLPVVQGALRAEPNNEQFRNLEAELNRLSAAGK
jgi:hypothetical protein